MFKFCTTVLLLVIGLLLSACQSTTTLILLPDANGKVGAVTVKSHDEIRLIDKAYESVTTTKTNNGLAKTQALNKAQVDHDYAELLKAQPANASSFLLYFHSGTTQLTQDSMALIPDVLDKIKANMPTEISVIGHTDTKGTESINNELSKRRAVAIEQLLKQKLPTLSNVTVMSFGSKNLLVPTAPNVDEIKNRRVEILIP